MNEKLNKQEKAVLFIDKIGNDKIVKTCTRSTKQLVNFVKKHDDITKIYINSDALTYDTIAQLLDMNKKVVILEKLTAKKALKLIPQ